MMDNKPLDSFPNLLGKSSAMQQIFKTIESVASTSATILITGESGTGKGVVAKAIHQLDKKRSAKPFVEVSCGALSETLLESELFGHIKGAFTGATADKIGRFELASQGTIFLDEIDTCSASLQVKLLRVLQDGGFERVGDHVTKKTEARVIVATNQNLTHLVKQGNFREDLFYRIHVIPIHLPPLRERLDDIDLLANHFIKIFNHKNSKNIKAIDNDVKRFFHQYLWPGNIRQLENMLEAATIMAKSSTITMDDLPKTTFDKSPESSRTVDSSAKTVESGHNQSLKESLEEPERAMILSVLQELKWNKSKAAVKLGINRTTLYNKLNKYDIK